MCSAGTKLAVVLSLIIVLVLGLALPGQAAWTKLYRFPNSTGVSQSSLKATTSGLESIISQYVGCCAYFSGWPEGRIGFTVAGGVFCTKLTYVGTAVGPNTTVAFGWTTADGSCRLRDLRWGGGQTVIAPELVLGIPGGGMLFYDYPGPGCVTIVITNDLGDLDPVIDLADVEFGVAGIELTLDELDSLLDAGLIELRVASIDEDIDVLLAEVESYGVAGELSGPSANSLMRKLEKAVAYKHDGLDKYLVGDLDKALTFWARSAKHVGNFVSEVTASAQKGNLALDLYNRWVVDGGGEIAPAPEIMDALLALPEGEALQSLAPLPPGTPLPAYPGLDPGGYVQWPVTELYPGEYTAFVVCDLDLGTGFIMGGSLLDAGGNVVLDWLEQSVAEPGVIDTEPPVITSATTTPANLWPPDHSMIEMALDVTVEDDSYAVWYVADVASNQPELGTGDGDYAPDWVLDPSDPQSVSLRSERSGNDPTGIRLYTITLRAIDTGGNLSEPYELVVPVDHDQG